MKRWLILTFLFCFSIAALAQENAVTEKIADDSGGGRIALVIGNSNYQGVAALKNPTNDAQDVADALRKLGFQVTLKNNVTMKEMTRSITRFGEQLKAGDVALFFYAGHGLQAKGRNFMVPIDAEINSEASIRSETVDVDQLLEQLSPARLSIVILDACRNNPYERSFRSLGGAGLAQIDAPKGTLIAYSTAPGRVAADGAGRNSLYTAEFTKALAISGMTVESVFKRVRINVAKASADRQVPWESSSLTGEFCFTNCANIAQKRLSEIERLQKIKDEELAKLRRENERMEEEKIKMEKLQAKIEEELIKQKASINSKGEIERLISEKEQIENEKIRLQKMWEHEKERLHVEYEKKLKEEKDRVENETMENKIGVESLNKGRVFIPPSF